MFSLVTLHVKNMEDSLAFYHGIMDMPILKQMAAGPMRLAFLGQANGVQLELAAGGDSHGEAAAPTGFSVGFTVKNIQAACARLAAAGVKQQSEIATVSDGTQLAFFAGPDGESVELIQYA